jgi:decaprenyl-phosphate phosphoribosyltransferase
MLNPYIKLIRPSNWIKNILIFIPFFLGKKYSIQYSTDLILGFISFSLMASVGYIINDIRDIDKDRQHQHKKHRPLASGTAKVKTSFIISIILFISSICLSYIINYPSLIILLSYFIINYFYSIKGKDLRFVDIMILSSFYLIRVIYGAQVAYVPLTGWFVATLAMIVFGISINKRFMELKISINKKLPGRAYTKEDETLLHALMINFSIGALILLNIHAYFVLQIQTIYFYCAINVITPGIIFFYFDYSNNKSDDPVEKIIKNKGLLILTLLLLMFYYYEIIINQNARINI